MPRRERVELELAQVQITNQGRLAILAKGDRSADTAKKFYAGALAQGIFGAEF